MAADSKHSVLQIAPSLCENQRYDSQEKGSGCYPWQAELQATRDHRTITDILERRSAEVRRLYEECQHSADECYHLEKEWLALVTEKDRNLRQQIEEEFKTDQGKKEQPVKMGTCSCCCQTENEEAKRNQVRQLYSVLESLGTFNFDKPKEAILKRNLAKMYQQIGKYCRRNNIDITKKTRGGIKSAQAPNENVAAPLPPQMLIPPPPPPPPLALTPFLYNKAPKRKACESQSRKSCTPSNRPNEELLKRIRNGCQSELRSTPFKRSPGGTPLKRPRRMSGNDTSDVITLALKRKFKNVVFQSPKESDSPRSLMSPGDMK